jgi:hypothetical protein
MREYVFDYANVSQSLQNRKTLLLKKSSISESARRKFFIFIRLLDFTSTEKQVFDQIQTTLFISRRRIHFDVERQLYENVDVSKEFDIDVMIYHVKNDDENLFAYSSKLKIELILFLSRQLKSVEKNYWSTKLEIIEIVFIIRKIRHMIKFFKKSTILFTDHESVLRIVKQTSLFTFFIDRLNLRLIRVFEYIQQFNVIIKHKSDKQHIVSDALSRLVSDNDESNTLESEELDVLFIIALIKMKFKFKAKIIDEYFTDSKWKKILHTLFKNTLTKLSFTLKIDDLIYRSDQIALEHVYEFKRLCISSIIIKNILNIVHDSEHFDFVKCYDIISFFWYIHELTKHLRQYLRHCFKCQVFQIRKHKSYDSLQSIFTSDVLFHIITIDFILALSDIDKHDCAMFVICKFSKRICLIFEKISWKTRDWVLTLLFRLKILNWELSKAIISDKDSKFLIELWKIIFDRLEVKFLYSTVYHSQSDEQSKRSNQIMKIALRFHLFCLNNLTKWFTCLSMIQSQMNNFMISLDKTLNEIVYEFIFVQSTDLTKNIIESQKFFTFTRKQIVDVVAWAQMIMKQNYDRKHHFIHLKVDDYALLRLHKDYFIFSFNILSKKLFQQYADLFRIIEKIDNLVYRLNFSNHWRIHFVVFIVQLKSASNSIKNSYNRFRSEHSEFIHVKEDTSTIKSFEIEVLINRRTTTRRKMKYLVRWKDYELEHYEWRNLDELQNALKLIQKYEKFMKSRIILSDQINRTSSKFIIDISISLMNNSSTSVTSTSLNDISFNNSSQSTTSL